MKRFLSILLVVVLVSALFVAAAVTAGAKKSKTQKYLQLIHPAERAGEDQFVCWVIPWDDVFEQNKQYTFFANVMFGDDINPNNGCAYVNVYSYGNLDAAMSSDFAYLFAFMDFAIANASTHPEPNKWTEYSYTFDPSINLRGASGDKCEAVWISVGFWMATGTISVLDLGVKDPDTDEIIYYRDFTDGIDYDEPNFRFTADMEEENRGIYWDLLDYKADDKKEESSEEPEPEPESSEEPEPEPESSEEPEPEPESSEEPEPEPESSEEPEPEPESSEEAKPVDTSEPAAEPSADEQPSQTEPAASEAPAASNGPGPVLWIILGAVAVAIAIAVILILVLRKKKA